MMYFDKSKIIYQAEHYHNTFNLDLSIFVTKNYKSNLLSKD